MEQVATQRGFTLVEIVITVAIIGFLTLLVAYAYPSVRQNQQLILGEQRLQAQLRDAQQRAINEERAQACLDEANAANLPEIPCSDIGIALEEQALIMFADTHNIDGNEYSSGDFIVGELALPDAVTVDQDASAISLLFQAVPPSVTFFADGAEQTRPVPVTLHSGESTLELFIHSYGQVTRQ